MSEHPEFELFEKIQDYEISEREVLQYSGITGQLEEENKYKTPITSDRGDYYYNLYGLFFINTACSQEVFDAYVEKVRELKVFFEEFYKVWLEYFVIALLFDLYIYFKKPTYISKVYLFIQVNCPFFFAIGISQ